MLNKNDPLIGAVQEVMKKNQTERNAVKLVNEKFGVVDRKALPHERQGEWDAAYKQVLSEGVDPSKYSEKQKKIARIAGNPNKIDSEDLSKLRSMKEGQDPYAENEGGSAVTTVKPTSITPNQQNALKKKIQGIMKEAKSTSYNPYAIGMSAVEKSTGDKPPMEKKNIKKAHDIAKKIMAKKMNEGFNNRHSLSVHTSAEKQAMAVLNEVAKKITPGVNDSDTEGNRVYMGGGGFNPAALPDKIGGPDRNKGAEVGGSGRRISIGTNAASQSTSAAKYGTLLDKIKAATTNARPFNKRQLPVARVEPNVPAVVQKSAQKPGAPVTAVRRLPVARVEPNVPAVVKKPGAPVSAVRRLPPLKQVPQRLSSDPTEKGRIVGLSNLGKTVVGAAGAGLAAGLGGYVAQNNSNPKDVGATTKRDVQLSPPKVNDNPKVTQTTSTSQPDYDKMSFKDAFKAARKQAGGASGKFTYKGKEYQTNIQGTGTAKKPQEKYLPASKLKKVAPAAQTTTTKSVVGGQGIGGISSRSTNKPRAS